MFVAASLSACASVPRHTYYPAPGSYVTVTVQQGDTLSEIATRYRVDEDDIAAMNRLHDHDVLVVGQVLRVPAYGRVVIYTRPRPQSQWQPSYRQPPQTHWQPSAAPQREARIVAPHEAPSTVPMPIPKPHLLDPPSSTETAWSPGPHGIQTAQLPPPDSTPSHQTPATSATPPAPATLTTHGDHGEFMWPLDGVVISSFGSRTDGQRNDGINIEATGGEDVRAAADGTVTYAGNELKGYGNLVLIKHSNGFTTAYAHVDHIAVARGDRVAKGQVIATAAATGDVSEPQLHFELRKGVQPVDPRPYLQAYGL